MIKWTFLEGNQGTFISQDANHAAAATAQDLTVWAGENSLAQYRSEEPVAGWPVFAMGKVFWGWGSLDLASGKYTALENAGGWRTPAGVEQTPMPSGHHRVSSLQWNAAGSRILVGLTWTGGGQNPSKIVLLDGKAQFIRLMWEGPGTPPLAAFVSENYIAIGEGKVRVFDAEGAPILELAEGIPPLRVCSTESGKEMLIVRANRLEIVGLPGGEPLANWPDHWLDADISPDGKRIAAISQEGKFYLIHVSGGQPQEIGTPTRLRKISLGQRRVVASFSDGRIATANL